MQSSTREEYVLQYRLDVEIHRSARPDLAGNLLEVIWLELEEVDLVIHAMPLRARFYALLPQSPEDLT